MERRTKLRGSETLGATVVRHVYKWQFLVIRPEACSLGQLKKQRVQREHQRDSWGPEPGCSLHLVVPRRFSCPASPKSPRETFVWL